MKEGFDGVGEFEAFRLVLAENSTAVYPDWEAGGSSSRIRGGARLDGGS
jgi:hypothetical protein